MFAINMFVESLKDHLLESFKKYDLLFFGSPFTKHDWMCFFFFFGRFFDVFDMKSYISPMGKDFLIFPTCPTGNGEYVRVSYG